MNKLEAFFADAKRVFGIDRGHEDFEQITAIPDGFSTNCYHNNSAPSLGFDGNATTEDGDYINCDIFISSKNPENRSCGESHQFIIQLDGGGKGYSYEYLSDSWQDIIEHAETAKKLLKALIDVSNKKDMQTAFKEVSKTATDAGFSFWE